jgi:SAM-dependent methyltransferase
MGCGCGRHSLELARRGYNLVGVDPSQAMIEAARQASTGLVNPPQFVQTRAEDYQTDQRFDGVICLFTTLGQIEVEQDNRQLVGHAANLLKPGGSFIVEVPHRAWVIQNLKTKEVFQTPESSTNIERSYDNKQGVVTETFTIVTPAERREYLLRYRIFNVFELKQLVNNSGFEVIDIYSGYHDVPFDEASPVIVMFAANR